MTQVDDVHPLGIAGIRDPVEVGRGGFGTVYAAMDTATGRSIAVKVLAAVPDPRQQARFEAECRAMATLSHLPFIARIDRWGRADDDRPFLIMEYLPGGSLGDRLQVGGRLAPARVRILGDQIAMALSAAHRVGIIHRDVKPENVLLDSDGQAKLTDFGIAVVTGMTAGTTTGTLVASFAHVAPELLDGGRPTPLVDVYSLGSTLVTLLLGHPPFQVDGETPSQLLARVLQGTLPDLRPYGVPDDLDGIIRRAMARDPSQRTPSAEQMAAELRGSAGPSVPTGLAAPADLEVARGQVAPAAPRSRRRRPLVLGAVLGVGFLVAAVALVLNLLGSSPTTKPASRTGATAQPPVVLPTRDPASATPSVRPVPSASTSSAAPTDEPCKIGVGTGCYNANQHLRADAGKVNIREKPSRTSNIVATANGGQTVKADCMGGADTLEGGDGSSDMWVGVDLGNGFSGWIIASVFADTSNIQPCD